MFQKFLEKLYKNACLLRRVMNYNISEVIKTWLITKQFRRDT